MRLVEELRRWICRLISPIDVAKRHRHICVYERFQLRRVLFPKGVFDPRVAAGFIYSLGSGGAGVNFDYFIELRSKVQEE